VALLLDRKSLAVDESATLRDRMSFSNDGIVTVKLTFDDEKVIQVDLRFPKGTPIPVATTELARSLIRKGLDVNFVPEVGAVRINFAPGLKDASANASTTTFVEIHYGKRDEFGRDKRLGLPASCSEIH